MRDDDRSYDALLSEVAALRRRVANLESARPRAAECSLERTKDAPARPGEMAATPRIFVMIASYTDPELPRTIRDCIDNATHPEALRFGICWQYDTREPIDLDEFRKDERFRFADFSIEESQGGPWARNIAQRFWDGEPYTLLIDSHMKFEPAWDVKLLDMFSRLPGEKPLITVNSPLFWYDDRGKLHRQTDRGVPTTRLDEWIGSFGWAPWFNWGDANKQKPGRSRFISGGFIFTLGQWHREVPADPDHYYWGSEFSVTVRSFTHGYDLFLPDEIVAWHMYHRHDPPRRHWEHGEEVVRKKRQIAFERLRKLIYSNDVNDLQELGRYGLGTERTRREYEIYAGMDLTNKRAHPDVYSGNNPDPVTIKSEQDWDRCLTFEDHKRVMEAAAAIERTKPS